MKIKTKEAYKQVYNWQFAHCVDFWCIVLARACDVKAEEGAGKPSELRPLIYPLVQVSLGAVKCVFVSCLSLIYSMKLIPDVLQARTQWPLISLPPTHPPLVTAPQPAYGDVHPALDVPCTHPFVFVDTQWKTQIVNFESPRFRDES